MDAGAEGHAGVDDDAEAASGGGVVAPLWDKEEAAANVHGLKQIAGRLHPIALFFLSVAGAGKEIEKRGAIGGVFKEGADGLCVEFDDAGRALLPQLGNEQVAVFRVAIDFEREHCFGPSPWRGAILEMKMKLQGIFPPIATPFDSKGDIYVSKIRHNVEKWNLTALSGYVVMGSTGESVMMMPEEKYTMWDEVAKYAAADKLLIAGTGAESVRETVLLTNRAAEMGYKAAMVRTPHYYKNLVNRGDAQMLYYRAVADQSKIPLIIYNWPQTTGVDIPVETVVGLSEHPNVIAIKESSGNLEKVMKMVREVKHGFQVLVGSAPTLWPSLLMGACGAILAYANAAPYSVIAIWEAYRAREEAAGMDWQGRIGRPAALVTTKYGIPGLKYAMDLNGYYGGPPRLPLTPPTAEAKREIEEAFRDLKG